MFNNTTVSGSGDVVAGNVSAMLQTAATGGYEVVVNSYKGGEAAIASTGLALLRYSS